MIPSFRQDDWAASFVERGDDVVENESIACIVDGERPVDVLDPTIGRGIPNLKSCLPYDKPMLERSTSRMTPWINLKAYGSELHLENGVMAVASLGRGRETQDVPRPHLGHHAFEGNRGNVVTLVLSGDSKSPGRRRFEKPGWGIRRT
jgi:hypothetical protein